MACTCTCTSTVTLSGGTHVLMDRAVAGDALCAIDGKRTAGVPIIEIMHQLEGRDLTGRQSNLTAVNLHLVRGCDQLDLKRGEVCLASFLSRSLELTWNLCMCMCDFVDDFCCKAPGGKPGASILQ